jgi:hypothetical protein
VAAIKKQHEGIERVPSDPNVESMVVDASNSFLQLADHISKLSYELRLESVDNLTLDSDKILSLRVSLSELVTSSTEVARRQNWTFLPAMNSYIGDPSSSTWNTVQRCAREILQKVKAADTAFGAIKNEYLFEDSYQDFRKTFSARGKYLRIIIDSRSPIDVGVFQQYRDAYSALISNIEDLIKQLSKFAREELSAGRVGTRERRIVLSPSGVKTATPPLVIISILGALAGVLFGVFGIWLAFLGGPTAVSHIKLFGQEVTTESIGVACVFVGSITVLLTLRRVLKSLDIVLRK